MLLSGTLFALFMTGFWLYCLTDAILTPAAECRALPKPAWIVLITVTFIGGAIAWLIVREPAAPPVLPLPTVPYPDSDSPDDEGRFLTGQWTAADDAVARHPAGRNRALRTVATVEIPVERVIQKHSGDVQQRQADQCGRGLRGGDAASGQHNAGQGVAPDRRQIGNPAEREGGAEFHHGTRSNR